MTLDAFMKNIQNLLLEAADALKDTADQMYTISKSIKKAEKEFRKLEITEDDLKISPMSESDAIELSKDKPEEKKGLSKIGPPARITSKVAQVNQTSENILVKPPIIKENEISEERKSLFNITDRISGLLDKLKEKVITKVEEPVGEPSAAQEKGLSSFKDQISNLNDRFKNYMKQDDLEDMTPEQRKKALKDMAEAINILTEEYNKDFLPKDI